MSDKLQFVGNAHSIIRDKLKFVGHFKGDLENE
jgi:hypothetical protein